MYDAEIGTLKRETYVDFLNNFQVEWRLMNSLILRARVMLSFKRNDGDEFLPATHSNFAGITKDSRWRINCGKGLTGWIMAGVVTCPGYSRELCYHVR